MYLDLEVTILYVIQMSNEVHLIDLPRFTAISREWKTIGQILKTHSKLCPTCWIMHYGHSQVI